MLLRYGEEEMQVQLPARIPVRELNIKKVPTLEDPEAAIKKALLNPTAGLPLRELVVKGETVCMLVNDSTRVARSEVFLPLILEELRQGGVKDEDVFVVFTNGSHRPLTDEEMVSLVGREMAQRVPLFNHDCYNKDRMVYLGETSRKTPIYVNRRVMEADKRVLTGSVVFHFMAGFGGGRKALIPGVAGIETIQANHRMMLEETARLGILEGNPVHEDLLEAAMIAGGDYLLNVVLNERKEFLKVFTGHMDKAHLEGCSFVREVYGAKIERPGDVVIASCGGYPRDIDLYQSQKTLENAVNAVKEGGSVILLAQCPEGVGSKACESWARRYPDYEELSCALRENFQLGGHKAYAIARALQKATVYLVSQLPEETARFLGFVPAPSLEEAVKAVYRGEGSEGKFPLTYIMPQGSLTVPFISGR